MKVLNFPPHHTLKTESDDHAKLDAAIAALTKSMTIGEKIELIASLSEE